MLTINNPRNPPPPPTGMTPALWVFLFVLAMGALSMALLLSGCSKPVEATHKVLAWNSNTEPDMKEYRVYACASSPCLASGAPLAVVPHVAVQPSHTFIIPHTDQFYVVYAVDLALNVSAPSATIFADVTPPAAPANLRVQ